MKRTGNIYADFASVDNLILADEKARKGKTHQPGVKAFDRQRDTELLLINESLINNTFKTSPYTIFKVHEPKERVVYRLPYSPDRIVQHAAMNKLEKLFVSTFTADTYSCVKGRGPHKASAALSVALKDTEHSKFYLKLDVEKFYPNIYHEILKRLLRRKIKDKEMIAWLDGVIDSAPGVPIGNYLSQYLANFYLAYFDHWIKEQKAVKYYFRYCDDMVILAPTKKELHQLLADIRAYLWDNLKLKIKGNYRVAPTWCKIDFCGFVHAPGYKLMRKELKKRFARSVKKGYRPSVASYYGWAKHSNSKNLLKKLLMNNFSDLGIKRTSTAFVGDSVKIRKILDRELIVHDCKIGPSKYPDKGNGLCLCLQLEIEGKKCITFTGSVALQDLSTQVKSKNGFPVKAKIVEVGESFEFVGV